MVSKRRVTLGHHSWLVFKSLSHQKLSTSIEESCLLLSRRLKSAEIKQARRLANVATNLHIEIIDRDLMKENLTWLPDILGQITFQHENISFYPLPQVANDLDFHIIHQRAGEDEVIDSHPVELWNGDFLTFCKGEHRFTVTLESAEIDLGEVLAERSFKDVPNF